MIEEVTPYNFDEILFEYFEGTLNDVEKQKFLAFVEQNPSYKKDLDLWEQSFAASDNIEVPQGLENTFLKKEGFWESKKGKITVAAGAVGTVAAISAAILLNKEEKPIENIVPKTEQIDPSSVAEPLTKPSMAPFPDAIPAGPTKKSIIKSESRNKVLAPQILLNENFNKILPNSTQQSIKTDSVQTTVIENNVNNQKAIQETKENSEKPKVIEETKEKNDKLELKINDSKLGKPKNIIDMQQNLEEN